MNLSTISIATLFATWTSAAFFGEWFLHKNGELYSYHGDWLTICENVGKGDCWVHQTLLAPNQTRVDPNSISIRIRNDQRSMLDVHNHGMAPLYGNKITSIIDRFVYNLNENHWKYGSHKSANLRETDTIVDFDLTVEIVNKLKAAKTLKAINLTDEAEFSHQRITVAIAEIERQIKGRM